MGGRMKANSAIYIILFSVALLSSLLFVYVEPALGVADSENTYVWFAVNNLWFLL